MGQGFATWQVVHAFASNPNAGTYFFHVKVGTVSFISGGPSSLQLPLSFNFTDARINGGSATFAWLEVHAFNTGLEDHTVEFTRLVFDNASTARPELAPIAGQPLPEWSAIPEPSSFALLGLGAAGLLARRRRQAA
jgi:hypothetical protein